jgi:large subunit ribosomal protein L2
LAFKGHNIFKLSKNLTNNKSGFWRKFGSKSVVRGVAKNPVDHPNGGRTKSIKTPKTP